MQRDVHDIATEGAPVGSVGPRRGGAPAPGRGRGLVSRAGLALAFANLGLAALYLAFAAAHARNFLAHPRPSLVCIVALETLFAIFFVARREAATLSRSPTAWLSTVLGTFVPLLFRPTGVEDLAAAQIVQVAGTAFGVAGVLSLNRSVGLLPANRGIRTGGAYRLVRHPLYASYLVTHLGYVGSNPSAWNVTVALAGLAAQLVRIRCEERLLSRDPEYVAYAARTRWRLVPFLF